MLQRARLCRTARVSVARVMTKVRYDNKRRFTDMPNYCDRFYDAAKKSVCTRPAKGAETCRTPVGVDGSIYIHLFRVILCVNIEPDHGANTFDTIRADTARQHANRRAAELLAASIIYLGQRHKQDTFWAKHVYGGGATRTYCTALHRTFFSPLHPRTTFSAGGSPW